MTDETSPDIKNVVITSGSTSPVSMGDLNDQFKKVKRKMNKPKQPKPPKQTRKRNKIKFKLPSITTNANPSGNIEANTKEHIPSQPHPINPPHHGTTSKARETRKVRFKLPGESGPTPADGPPISTPESYRMKVSGNRRRRKKLRTMKDINQYTRKQRRERDSVKITLRVKHKERTKDSKNEVKRDDSNITLDEKRNTLLRNGVIKSDKMSNEDIERLYNLCTTSSTKQILVSRS